jgi:hypothetical protein
MGRSSFSGLPRDFSGAIRYNYGHPPHEDVYYVDVSIGISFRNLKKKKRPPEFISCTFPGGRSSMMTVG